MFIDLTREERDVLKTIESQSSPAPTDWKAIDYLHTVGLIQRASHSRYSTPPVYELSREGRTYLRRHP